MERANRLRQIIDNVNEELFEKGEALKLAILCSLAGESIFFLGPPGVAKSMIARRLKYIFQNGSAFEYLMNRFSTPDEIFGPLSVTELKDGKYVRLTKGYLPASDVVFLDEIWKAGPAIQNTLLTVLNEKIFRNGDIEDKISMKALLAASNELPETGLEALWDRFLVRYLVSPISDPKSFERMLHAPTKNNNDFVKKVVQPITKDEYDEWQELIDFIDIPVDVINVIHVVRHKINEQNENQDNKKIYISDRRWRKIAGLLRASAFLNDRDSVDLMDAFLISHCIWETPEQIDWAKDTVSEAIKLHGYTFELQIGAVKLEIDNFRKEVELEIKQEKKVFFEKPKEYISNGQPVYKFTFNNQNYEISKVNYDLLQNGQKIEIPLMPNYRNSYDYPRIIKSSKPNTLSVVDRYNTEAIIETETDYKIEVLTKKPHKPVVVDWNNRVVEMTKQIDIRLEKLAYHRNEDLATLKTNLFVPAELSAWAEINLAMTEKRLNDLKIELEKIKYDYDHVK